MQKFDWFVLFAREISFEFPGFLQCGSRHCSNCEEFENACANETMYRAFLARHVSIVCAALHGTNGKRHHSK